MTDLLLSCVTDRVNITTDESEVVFSSDKTQYYFKLVIDGDKLDIQPNSKKPETQFLHRMIQKKGFTNVNEILDFGEFCTTLIPRLTSYCVGCMELLEFQADSFITCGKKECDFKFESLRFGNPVVENCKTRLELVQFLIESTFDAATCDRKFFIFEPFPSHFLKCDIETKRGELSALEGDDYNNLKDFKRIDKMIKKFNMEEFFEAVDLCATDEQVEKAVGEDVYMFVRFVIMSNKMDIYEDQLVKSTNRNNMTSYKIRYTPDREEEFEKLKTAEGGSTFLFHGSRWHNWYSILRNGLKNCSGTKLMTAGAAYGNGIYLSDNLNYSYRYGASGSKSVVGVFEVVGARDKFKKANQIYVVPDGKYLVQRYLMILKNTNPISELNGIFNTTIYTENAKVKSVVSSKAIKKMNKELKKIRKQDSSEVGFRVDPDEDDMYKWNVGVFNWDSDSQLGQDMTALGIEEIELEVMFKDSYPFNPPFVRVVQPRFEGLTGHVTRAGALCMEVLTEKGWTPAVSIESLIMTIRAEMLEGGAKLDKAKYNIPYSLAEAKRSFVAVARGHGWM